MIGDVGREHPCLRGESLIQMQDDRLGIAGQLIQQRQWYTVAGKEGGFLDDDKASRAARLEASD